MKLSRVESCWFERREMVYSEITNRDYNSSDCVYIPNIKQAARYIKNGALPVDIVESDGKLCFVFLKLETRDLYKAWCDHTLA